MVDESLWMEQSNVDDAGILPSPVFNSQYIVVKPISPNINAEGEDNCPSKLDTDTDRGVLLKETTV